VTRDELRSRYLGHHALRRFAREVHVSIEALRDAGDIGGVVEHAVSRVRAADRDRAWGVAEEITAPTKQSGYTLRLSNWPGNLHDSHELVKLLLGRNLQLPWCTAMAERLKVDLSLRLRRHCRRIALAG